jgi:hypothetical protein
LDKPLHVIYKVSKLAYRICVILIANERVKKLLVSPMSTEVTKMSNKSRYEVS